MKSFAAKHVFLTGAASGIGYALATQLAAAGARLFLVDRDVAGLQKLLSEMPSSDQTHFVHACDLTDKQAVTAATSRVLAEFGAVDLLINNAGVGYYGRTELMTAESWDTLMSVNLLAPIQITRELLPHLLTRPDAHIANMCSISGLVAGGRFSAYHTSKFGLMGLTESLRAEYGRRGLGVTAICPGPVRTNLYVSATADNGERKAPSPPAWLCASADRVAGVTLRAIRRNKRQVLITPTAHVLFQLKRFVPGLIDFANHFSRKRFRRKPVAIPLNDAHTASETGVADITTMQSTLSSGDGEAADIASRRVA